MKKRSKAPKDIFMDILTVIAIAAIVAMGVINRDRLISELTPKSKDSSTISDGISSTVTEYSTSTKMDNGDTPEPESIAESIEEPDQIAEPVEEPKLEAITEPIKEPEPELIAEPIEEPEPEPITELIEEPEPEPITEPIEEPEKEPITEPIEEPESEPVTESVTEQTTKRSSNLWGEIKESVFGDSPFQEEGEIKKAETGESSLLEEGESKEGDSANKLSMIVNTGSIPMEALPITVISAESSCVSYSDSRGARNINLSLDRDDATSWQEGVPGPGINETLIYQFNHSVDLQYILLKLGNWNPENGYDYYFYHNYVPSKLKITMSDGTEFFITEEDIPYGKEPVIINFSDGIQTEWVQFTILDVFSPGSSDNFSEETCITDIAFYQSGTADTVLDQSNEEEITQADREVIERDDSFDQTNKAGDISYDFIGSDLDVIVFSGTGNMEDYDGSPWGRSAVMYSEVIISPGVTSIGKCLCAGMIRLSKVTIPNTVTVIRENAFIGCDDLLDVVFTGTEEEWNNILIENGNEPLANATIHYNAAF